MNNRSSKKFVLTMGVVAAGAVVVLLVLNFAFSTIVVKGDGTGSTSSPQATTTKPAPVLDVAAYNSKMLALANLSSTTLQLLASTTLATTSPQYKMISNLLWPAKNAPLPLAGALLPFNRIVAYYGNFYSKQMGVLGQYDPAVVLQKLASTSAAWAAADPSTPVLPAIDYIAVTAQASGGVDGMYRARMPDSQIDKALGMANQVHGIVILDVQVGLSTLQKELPALEKYLKMPNVHLAIDPEFSMKGTGKPGTVIGYFDAQDINYAASYLASLVQAGNLPPKILVVHRFTGPMVLNYKKITPLPEVQIVMDMDGWGAPFRKIGTYQAFIAPQPVQFTGFKLFYKNDLRPPSTRLLMPSELLNLSPKPIFVQYQ